MATTRDPGACLPFCLSDGRSMSPFTDRGPALGRKKKKTSINRKASTDTQTYLQKDTEKSLLNERGG